MKKTVVWLSIFLICCIAGAASAEQAAPSEASTAAADGRTLVAYYSATGNTRAVAEVIARETQADLLELVPEVPYTEDDLNWRDSESRASREYANPNARAAKLVEATAKGWEAYDVVYIGYPIWWQIAAWPVNEFVLSNDFTGKTVIPFCTSSSSGYGESGALLAEMAGTGNWIEATRFASGAEEDVILTWMDSLTIEGP